MVTRAASPAATGPAGSQFEAKVGAYYLPALLLDADPLGLPGAVIDRVQLQRAGEGYPLDDVIVKARTTSGDEAVLEIQAKRTVKFSPGDTVFRDVVGQIVEAVEKDNDRAPAHMFAIATARGSHKIDGPYQEVLRWARHLDDVATFFARLQPAGAASNDMRTFVDTLRTHVVAFGGIADNERIWKLLRRMQILVFDFASDHGQSEALVRERCASALDSSDVGKAGALWATLSDIAQTYATSGGELTAHTLRDELTTKFGFRLAGIRNNTRARSSLFEASLNALRDIGDRVGRTSLARRARLDAVNAARDIGRYVEIRGDAGVGKSGVLKSLAAQIAIGSNAIVLSPGRTIPRGWTNLRATIGFDGSARDLLRDVASSGGATLFIDSIDFFDDLERKTVADLVSAAADVPGFVVVVTARRNFGEEEPNWLPKDALDKLGHAPTIIIDELSEEEVKELTASEPKLATLLADGHPAREVVRNLYRLARLVNQASDDPVPRTEADMALLWWETADGKADAEKRTRSRILRNLADQSLSGQSTPLDTSSHPPPPLNALVASGTLRALGAERMTFRHDVLRDWAVANVLFEEPAKIDQLQLDKSASATLFRGVELAARMAIERSSDAERWKKVFDSLSQPGAHGSWRRAVLTALVRSEQGGELLKRADTYLLAEKATLLRELVRTIMAIDVRPANELLQATRIDRSKIPAGLNLPIGPSWRRLVMWSLQLGDSLPAAAIPEIVDLYTGWLLVMLLVDPIAPQLITNLHDWLMEIERAGGRKPSGERKGLFEGVFDYDQMRKLETDLRSSFLLFCVRTPNLAEQYIAFIAAQGRRGENTARGLLKSRGTLAQGAPKALAELTAKTLIPVEKEEETTLGGNRHRDPFTFADSELLPAAPAQGPFLELLVYAPETGLELVRQLVAHACTFCANGQIDDLNAIVIEMKSGPRRFPWSFSYDWSRQAPGQYCVTSALMALEAWAHGRIEEGETVNKVVDDILGDGELPSAFLLVIVDILISHWPKSQEIAVPFLGCPELLSLDRTRQIGDSSGVFDVRIFRDREPSGLASLDSLRKRSSRRYALEQLIGCYAHSNSGEAREALANLLRAAAARLGPYDAKASMANSELMVVHALNLLNPINYTTRVVNRPNGSKNTCYEYVPPASETAHLAPLQAEANMRMSDIRTRNQIGVALEDASKSSPELAARAAEWARRTQSEGCEEPDWIIRW